MNKEREINDTPNDKIDPDEVRIVKLEEIVERWYDYKIDTAILSEFQIGYKLNSCLNEINCYSESEKYTTEEIKDALCGHFIHDDIIIFLLKPYMENL